MVYDLNMCLILLKNSLRVRGNAATSETQDFNYLIDFRARKGKLNSEAS